MATNLKHLVGALAAALLVACAPASQPDPSTDSDDPELSSEPADSPDPDSPDPVPEELADVMDVEGNVICHVNLHSSCTATDVGIFYSIFSLGENVSTAPAVYGIMLPDQNKSVVRKTILGQGYESVFARTELHGNVYVLTLIGNPMDNAPDDLMLYGFLPSSNSVSKGRVTTNGFPYTAMTVSGDNLLIMSHEMSEPKSDKVYSFNGSMIKEVLCFASGEESESLRSICGTKYGFYLLRVHVGGTDGMELFLDKYDDGFRKVSEKSLSALIHEAAKQIGLVEEDAITQQGIHVSGFRVVDDRYLFYENFSNTRAIIDLKEDKVLFAVNDLYQMSTGHGRPLFYRLQFSESDEMDIVGIKDGAVEHIPFTPYDPHLLLQGISISPSGNCLIRLDTPSHTPTYVWTAALLQ